MLSLLSTPIGKSLFRSTVRSNTSYSVNTLTPGTLIAIISDPFAGQNKGTTTYSTFGTVPDIFTLQANGRIVLGSGTPTAGQKYAIGVLATSGDNTTALGETLTFTSLVTGTASASSAMNFSSAANSGYVTILEDI